MPELPEVEVVRLGLEQHTVGRKIIAIDVLHPRPVRQHSSGAAGFSVELAGREIDAVRRRGKYLWLVLGEDCLLVHLGMSGQFRIADPGDPQPRNTRVLFNLDDGSQLRFVDQRMFGGLEIVHDTSDPVPHIAPDPFSPTFDTYQVAERICTRRTTIKRALLDQRLVSGIGNIYADEALWRAKLNGDLATTRLEPKRAVETLNSAKEVMAEALAAGGTSFDSLYVNVNGESGYFERGLNVYGREGLPCKRCGTEIRRSKFMNRSSFWCPECQALNE